MELLKQNGKMLASSAPKTFNFGISAFMTSDGMRTCPNAGACAKGCYAKQGTFNFPKVRDAYESRAKVSKMQSFTDLMQIEISRTSPARIRIHDSGDFYSREYLEKWLEIAERNPLVQFYAYTKMISLCRAASIPANVTMIYSFGGKEDALINTKKDRHSRVFTSLEELRAAGYADASKDDAVATGKNKKIGLVYHGAKNRSFHA